jgi:hypothetical protein
MIYVFEPHADDAFLSLGAWIKQCQQEVTIVTVFGNPKRFIEAGKFANSVGAHHIGLGYKEMGSMDGTPVSIHLGEYPDATRYIVPLGLRHSEHYAVRKAADDSFPPGALLYYVDQPYALQLKNQQELNSKISGKTVWYMSKPHANKYNKKTVDIFQTQSRFFYYNKDLVRGITETIVR